MTDTETKQETPSPEDIRSEMTRQQITIAIILALLVFWGAKSPDTFLRVVLVALGFGGIIMIHEFGHFIVAKLGGIKVEAFSIGMGPVIFGIRKLKKGWRVRVFPKIGQPDQVDEGDNDTEYQIALLPIGGFVKMLGQSDTGAADAGDDPRSYANRPIWIRICVVSAGVVFNAIGAAVLFMALYMNGIDLPAGIVGDVIPNSPAYDAGIRPGDEIAMANGDYFEINGKRWVDFETVFQASLLSSSDEPVNLVIRQDGVEKPASLMAEKKAGDTSGLRFSGLVKANSLKVSRYLTETTDPNTINQLYDNFNLCRGDEIKSVNGEAVRSAWEYKDVLARTFQPTVELGVSRLESEEQATVSRSWPKVIDPKNGSRTMVKVSYPMMISPVVENFRNEFDLTHFGSLMPRLKVAGVSEPTRMAHIINWVREKILRKDKLPSLGDLLQEGDILVKVGDIDYPNYEQLRKLTTDYKNKTLPIVLLRDNEQGTKEKVEVTVTPKANPGSERVAIGFLSALDLENPVVAQVLPLEGLMGDMHKIPAGATITAINEQPIKTYFEIAAAMQDNAGKEIRIEYVADGKPFSALLKVSDYEPVHAEATVGYLLPFDEYTMNYEASNPLEAMGWGFKKVSHFIVGNIKTLGMLFRKEVKVSALSGPVGIISMTYQVTGLSLDRTLYFLGLISSCLAVMNLLPLPVLDGGHIVFLMIEKITGKPVHEKILVPVMYIGLALLLGLIIWVSFNDIARLLGL